jgi:hypothetical protein
MQQNKILAACVVELKNQYIAVADRQRDSDLAQLHH